MAAENDNPYEGMTPEEVIAQFESWSAHPGQNTYEIRPQADGEGVTVVKTRPDGIEVHVDAGRQG